MIVVAEENPEVSQDIGVDSDSNDDAVDDDGAILDGENTGDEVNVDDGIIDDDNVGDETDADEDENTSNEVNEDGENADDDINADEDEYADDEMDIGDYGIALMSEAGDTVAPVITITLQGQDYTCSLGGEIVYKYVNNHDLAFECSADQETAKLSYCLDAFTGTIAEAKGAEQIDSWTEASSSSTRIPLSADKSYVLYVKAVGADGQTTYARSGGIVVDTTPPNVSNLVNGGTYAEGTVFWVRDDHLDLESVTVNEKPVTPAPDGSYQVSANGTSCVIKAKDKAGNEMTCSITVSGKDLAENGVISANGIYSLKAGTSYELAGGEWQVGGDKSVYSGNSNFYVKDDRDYTFTKR